MITLIKHDLRTIKFILIAFLLGVPILGMLIKWDYSSISGELISYSTARMFSFLIYILVLGAVMKIGKYHEKNNGEAFLRTLPLTKYQIIFSRFLLTFMLSIIGGIIVYLAIPLFGFVDKFIEASRNMLVFSCMISMVLSGIYIISLDIIGFRKLFPISWFVYFLIVVFPALLTTIAKLVGSLTLTKIFNSILNTNWILYFIFAIVIHFMLAVVCGNIIRKRSVC